MDVLLLVIAAIVGINAVVVAALVVRFRAEHQADDDDQLEHIGQLWDARRHPDQDRGEPSAA